MKSGETHTFEIPYDGYYAFQLRDGGGSSYIGAAFSEDVPADLPDRSFYDINQKQGYAIVSFIDNWK